MTVELVSEVLSGDDRLLMVVGNYGCGKTEIAVNLAIQLSRAGRTVQIADLDIVNPYFRCREARRLMEAHQIRVVVPPGAQAWADLPIILPEIAGMLAPPEGVISIFDVGGDEVGARALASFRTRVREGSYQLWQVINAKRPFTNTVEGCLEMRQAIETSSRLTITGLLVNSHLMEDTTAGVVLEGWRLACDVSRRSKVPVRGVAVIEELADSRGLGAVTAPLLRLTRHMLPPWMKPQPDEDLLPAARPAPLGKPPATTLPGTVGEMHGKNQD